MGALTIQTIVEAGITPTYAAASAGGDTAKNENGDMHLEVVNGGGASIDVTVPAQVTSFITPGAGATTKSDRVVAVGAGARAKFGPFGPQAFNDSNNNIAITYSGVTSVTIGAFRQPRVA